MNLVNPNTKLPPKRTVKLHLHNSDACRPFSLRYRRWIQRPSTIFSTVLAFLVKQRKCEPCWSRITTPTGSIPNLYSGYLRIPDPQRRGGTFHCSRKWKLCCRQQSSVYLVTIYHVITASFYTFMLVVLLLPSCYWRNYQIEAEYEPEYIILHLKDF